MTPETSYPDTPLSETQHIDLLARVFAGVSDPTRLHILLLLFEGERNVSELVSLTGVSQGRVSIHLQCLRWCGFVENERRGKFVYYQVRDARVRQLVLLAQELVTLHGEQLACCAVLNQTSASPAVLEEL